MSATAKTPITRHLTLVALFLAAGVFSLRLYDTLQPAQPASQVGSLQEREVTALLETVTGPGNVRVSRQAGAEQQWLVLINGTPDASRVQKIETILIAATGVRTGTDTLTISEFEFTSTQRDTLSYQGALELTGLGLIVVILSGLALVPSRSVAEPTLVTSSPLATPNREPLDRLQTMGAVDPSVEEASQLAERHPDETVRLLRHWMTDKTGNAA